jgi:hypothetical protein
MSFLFFLLYSAPHQVHHIFKQLPQAHRDNTGHDHSGNDRQDRSSTDSNCVFQISASRCHLGLAANIVPALLPILIRPLDGFRSADDGSSNLAAEFHIRAPPLA